MKSVIIGTGAYIPEITKTNADFEGNEFYNPDGQMITEPGNIVTRKFQKITGIQERRYASDELNTSDLGCFAALKAIEDAGIDPEDLDHIIVAHNFGDISAGSTQSDLMPPLASKIKHKLKIKNPASVAYDLIFGCPGWVQGVIQADSFIKSGLAKNILVIGCEALSRVVDPHDRDSMIFSDGAGACILSAQENSTSGILATSCVTHAYEEANFLFCGTSNKPTDDPTTYIKMHGRKIYEYALSEVPKAMKTALDNSGRSIEELKKVFIHQANEKMDEAIIHRFYKLYNQSTVPEDIMPMSIHKLGNSSVATVPTLLDKVRNNELDNHEINPGDVILLASVGAGMHINAVVYEV